jgi:hypothetical protein
MRHRALVGAAVVAAAALVAGPGQAFAQEASPAGEFVQPHTVNVAFPFVIANQTLPAGKYTIEQPTRELLIFQEEQKKAPRVEAKVITRLAAQQPPITEPKLIFDKVGNTYYLSEVWFRGADGFLLYGAQEAHTHHFARAEKKK